MSEEQQAQETNPVFELSKKLEGYVKDMSNPLAQTKASAMSQAEINVRTADCLVYLDMSVKKLSQNICKTIELLEKKVNATVSTPKTGNKIPPKAPISPSS